MSRRPRAAGAGLLALCAAALGLAGVGRAAAGDADAELEELRRAIQASRERVAAYERRELGLLETLEALDQAAELLGREVDRARAEAAEARAALWQLEDEVEEASRKLELTRRAMSARAVGLYKAGEVGPVRILFAAENLADLLFRMRTLQRLLRQDADLSVRFREESEALAAAQASAWQAAVRRDAALARLTVRSAQLDGERGSRRRLVAQTRGDRSAERAGLIELEIAARAFEETLASLRSAPPAHRERGLESDFAALRGQLPPPVLAPIDRGFGRVIDAEFRTETFRKGVDFAAPHGEPARAVAAGEVRFAGWFRGYGKLVILDHGDEYFTVSGHLSEIRPGVGDWVEAGQTIGLVGDTGSLSGARLYFEIRRGGEPLDPGEWLQAREPG